MRWECLVLCALAGGCAASREPLPAWQPVEPRSGSQLRMVHLESDEGERWLAGWHDREIGAACEPALSEDGRVRCHVIGDTVDYLTGCRSFGVIRHTGCAPPRPHGVLRLDGGESGCDGPAASARRSFVIGEQLDGPSPVVPWTRTPEGRCFARDEHGSSALDAIPIDDARLVEMELSPPGRHAGVIARHVFRGADGSAGMVGLFDLDRGAACALPERGDLEGSAPCLPFGAMRIANHHSCGPRAITSGCPEADVAFSVEGHCVPKSLSLAGVGAETPWCSDLAPFVFETRELDATYPVFTTELRGRGRLQARVWLSADGVVDFDPWLDGFYDTERGERCWPHRFSEGGEIRCLPRRDARGRERSRVFTDAECTRAAMWEGLCDEYVLWADEEDFCPYEVARISRTVAVIESYYVDAGAVCELGSLREPSSSTPVYEIEDVPLERFARLREVVD